MMYERRLPVTPVTLEVIRDAYQLNSLLPAWRSLFASVPSASPFQSPAWQMPWWRHFGRGNPYVMLFRNMDALVGILPCFTEEIGGLRALLPMGAGLSDYLDPLISPAHLTEVLRLLRSHLLGGTAWDLCEWRDLMSPTPFNRLALGPDFVQSESADVECLEIPIQGTFFDFWEGQPFSVRRLFLPFSDRGNLPTRPRFETVDQMDPEFVNALIRLHKEDWGNAKSSFLSDLIREMDEAGMLRFFGLRLQGKIAAVTLAFVHRRIAYSFATGCDSELEPRGYQGLLLFECLRYAFEHGLQSWNLLRGREPHKMVWKPRAISKTRLSIARKGHSLQYKS